MSFNVNKLEKLYFSNEFYDKLGKWVIIGRNKKRKGRKSSPFPVLMLLHPQSLQHLRYLVGQCGNCHNNNKDIAYCHADAQSGRGFVAFVDIFSPEQKNDE